MKIPDLNALLTVIIFPYIIIIIKFFIKPIEKRLDRIENLIWRTKWPENDVEQKSGVKLELRTLQKEKDGLKKFVGKNEK